MKLKDILATAEVDAIVREEYQNFRQDTNSYNGVGRFLERTADLNDPAIQDTVGASMGMDPKYQRVYLEQSASDRQKNLVDVVSGNLEEALQGFKKKENLASYLVSSPIEPKAHKGSDEFMDIFGQAYDGGRVLRAVEEKDEAKLDAAVNGYVTSELDRLKRSGKLDSGMLGAVAWTYRQNAQHALGRVVDAAKKKVKKFVDKMNIDEAKEYVSERFGKLKGKDKDAEALAIGRTVYALK